MSTNTTGSNEQYLLGMSLAIEEALTSKSSGDHPVGVVVVYRGQIISRTGNRTHRDLNPTHHAEVVAIGQAAQKIGSKNLSECILYTTHEPCPMCAAACVYARVNTIVFGTSVKDVNRFLAIYPEISWRSFNISATTIIKESDLSTISVIPGIMRDECYQLFYELLDARP